MKQFFALTVSASIIAVGLTTPATALENTAGTNRPIADKWALIVGISKYRNGKLDLTCAAKDAADFASFLTREGNFAADHVKLLTDSQATRANILSSIGDCWLPHVAAPDDLVVLYFSCHGSPSQMDVGSINYLVAHDTQPDNLFASGIPMQDLVHIIKSRVHSDRVVVILDACHSGAAQAGVKGIVREPNVDVDEIAQGTGQLVISSSQPGQVSWECKTSPNSVFTENLLSALRKNGGRASLGEAFTQLKENVQTQVLRERGELQTPVMKSKWEGNDLVLALPAKSPRPGITVSLPDAEAPPAVPQRVASVNRPGSANLTPPLTASVPPSATTTPAEQVTPNVPDIPRTWNSLEKNTWGTLRGTWDYDPQRREFHGTYNTGATSLLKLVEFSDNKVLLTGRFQGKSPTAPRGQEYSFSGTREGNRIHGTVTYVHLGFKIKGSWEAWW